MPKLNITEFGFLEAALLDKLPNLQPQYPQCVQMSPEDGTARIYAVSSSGSAAATMGCLPTAVQVL